MDGWASLLTPLMTDLKPTLSQKEYSPAEEGDFFSGLLSSLMKKGLVGTEGVVPAVGEGSSFPGRVAENLRQPHEVEILALLRGAGMEEPDAACVFSAPQSETTSDGGTDAKQTVLRPEMEAFLLGRLVLAIMKMAKIAPEALDVPEQTLAAGDDSSIVITDAPASTDHLKPVSCSVPASQINSPTNAKTVAGDDEALQVLALLVFDGLYGSARHEVAIASVPEDDGANARSAAAQASEHSAGKVSAEGQPAGVVISNITSFGGPSIEFGEKSESARKQLTGDQDGDVVDNMPLSTKESIADPTIVAALDAIPETVVYTLAGQMGGNPDPWGQAATTASAPSRDGGMAPPPVVSSGEQAIGNASSKARQGDTAPWRPQEADGRVGRGRTSGLTSKEVEKALQDVVAALRSGSDGEESSEKPSVELQISVTVSKEGAQSERGASVASRSFFGPMLQDRQPSAPFVTNTSDGNGKEEAAAWHIGAALSTDTTLSDEGGASDLSHHQEGEKAHVQKAEEFVLPGRDMTSTVKEGGEQKARVLDRHLPVTTVERFERIADQLASKPTGHDLTVRLGIGDNESVVLGLKDLGETVTVEIRASHQGMVSLLQTQKDAIARHLEGKDIRTSIFIDPNASGTSEKRERREARQKPFRSLRQVGKGFGGVLEVFA